MSLGKSENDMQYVHCIVYVSTYIETLKPNHFSRIKKRKKDPE